MSIEKESEDITTSKTCAFECDGCGEFFESWERLREHQVDCKNDESDSWL